MKLVRLSTNFGSIRAQLALGLGDAFGSSSYSTATRTGTGGGAGKWLWKGSMYKLYGRISPVGDPNVSIVPFLDQWVEEGKSVDKEQLLVFVKQLKSYNRFTHALQISMSMTDKRCFVLSSADIAVRLDLIAKVQGIEQAEKYFNSLPKQLKVREVCTALLICYANAKSADQAEVLIQHMGDLGLVKETVDYNSMMKVYYQSGKYEKLDSLMNEMEQKSINCDKYTFEMCAYAAQSDGEGIDKIVAMMEAKASFLDWTSYATAASGYTKAGLLDKALAVLRKSETLIFHRKDSTAYNYFITQYAACGNKDDVLRIWELYKQDMKVYNKGYICIIASLLKFDCIEIAEKIFVEWETRNLIYDFRVPNFLIGVFCRKRLLKKAETLIRKAKLKGGNPDVRTWYLMALGYIQNNQTREGVDAMKKALAVFERRWTPSKECLVACLGYFKKERDIEGAEHFLKLLTDREILPAELAHRLLNNIQNG